MSNFAAFVLQTDLISFFATVCDDNCKEGTYCRESGIMVCTISGLCSDSVLLELDSDTDEEDAELEAEILTEKGRFGTDLSLFLFYPPFPVYSAYLQHVSEWFCVFF